MALSQKQIVVAAKDLATKRGIDPLVTSPTLFNTLNWKRYEDEVRAVDEAVDSVTAAKISPA